jgi:hypothetical protein
MTSGWSVASAGDVNGDGFDDLIVGALCRCDGKCQASPVKLSGVRPGRRLCRDHRSGHPRRFGGFASTGRPRGPKRHFGRLGGDVNGDGFDDLLIGAYRADALGNAKPYANDSYLIFGGDFTGAVTHQGTAASETLTGTAGADVMIGGRENDILIGNGGADVLRGGEGDDILAISDLNFKRIVGGTGTDTLRLDGNGLTLDLTTIADNRIAGIEVIDITGSGNNTLTLDLLEVLNLSDESNTLIVRRNAGDVVNIGSGWVSQPDELIDDVSFSVFSQGAAKLMVQANITPEFSIAPSVSLNEGNSSTTTFDFVVTRGGLTTGSATLDYTFAAGDTSADDFVGGVVPGNGQVSFADGQTIAVISIAVNGDTVFEADESFSILISNPSVGSILVGQDTAVGTILNDDIQDIVAPTIARAMLAASNWSAAFIDHIDGGSGGGNGLGFELVAGALPLPWSGVNQLYIQFSEDVLGISASTIELRDSTGPLPITVAYDPLTFRAEVSLVTPLAFSKLRLAVADSVRDAAGNLLDGDSSGTAGGLFNLRFDVLAGDADGNGRVNGADLAPFSTAFNSQVSQPNYNPRANWNGDDRINGSDLGVFSLSFNRQLSSLTDPTSPFGGSRATGSSAVPHDSFFAFFGQDEEEEEYNAHMRRRRVGSAN